jgi:hypothetical protein
MKNALSKCLSKGDLIELLSIAHDSIFCIDHETLKQLVFQITNLDISYPSNYIEYYLSNKYYMIYRPVRRYIETLLSTNWSRTPCGSNNKKTHTSTVEANTQCIKNGWTYGIPYTESQEISTCWGGDRYDSSLRTKRLIEHTLLSAIGKKIIEL